MNKQRRKALESIQKELSDLKDRYDSIRDEEQEYYDNMPENLQGGDKGTEVEEGIEKMDEVSSSLDSALNELSEVTGIEI
jgi:uncharacterized coiled-coil DUF342 family protein